MKSKPFFALAALSLVLFFANKINAQGNNSETDSTRLHTFYLYLFNGYAVSYDLYSEEKSSVRLRLDFSAAHNDLNSDAEQTYSTSNGYSSKTSSNSESRDNNFSVTLSSYYIYSFYNSKLGQAYIGAGPLIGYSRYSYGSSTTYSDTLQSYYSYDSQNKNYSVGIVFLAGIRGYITERISFFAEANLNGGRTWTKSEGSSQYKGPNNYYSTQANNSSGSGWFYSSQFIRAGISVSF